MIRIIPRAEAQANFAGADRGYQDRNSLLGGGRWDLGTLNCLVMLGKGISSEVMLAEAKTTKKLYAIKSQKKILLVENDELQRPRIEKDILMLATSQKHPFIADLYATFQTETMIHFVLEYENGILYRNLKLENILLATDGHIEAVGFGLCKRNMWLGTRTKSFCGMQEFKAPEVLLDKEYGFAVDWWALGVLIYQMNFRQNPFRGESEDEIYDAIISDAPLYSLGASGVAVDIINKLLAPNPELRLGSGPSEALEVMAHEYFLGMTWEDLYNKRVPAPFVPEVKYKNDVSNFEPECTSVIPDLTLGGDVLSQAMQEEFRGFSYAGEEVP
ncbi:Serine/threonine kinase [Lambiella insularis]|nr:Serine/threonine kinase [Lambiella insularis]